jgi:hypothetical protein
MSRCVTGLSSIQMRANRHIVPRLIEPPGGALPVAQRTGTERPRPDVVIENEEPRNGVEKLTAAIGGRLLASIPGIRLKGFRKLRPPEGKSRWLAQQSARRGPNGSGGFGRNQVKVAHRSHFLFGLMPCRRT